MGNGRFDLRVAWALEPGEREPVGRVRSMRQRGEDLGLRLYGALHELAMDYFLVAAVGSDHPTLSVSLVHRAFDKLSTGGDVVLGPAADGGYYLVAVSSEALSERLFRRIPWSTAGVLESTLDRCRELDLKVDLLPTVADVDTPTDLAHLIATLDRDPAVGGRRTRSLLRSWNR